MVLTKHVHVSQSCCHTDPSGFIHVWLLRSSNCTHGLRHSQASNSAILFKAASSYTTKIFINYLFIFEFYSSFHTWTLMIWTMPYRVSIVFCIALNWPHVGHNESRLGHCTRCPSTPLISCTSCKMPCKHTTPNSYSVSDLSI